MDDKKRKELSKATNAAMQVAREANNRAVELKRANKPKGFKFTKRVSPVSMREE